MIRIDTTSVDPLIATKKFACDLSACKGACCTLPGGRGAPLQDEEVEEIIRAYPLIEELLPPAHREYIRDHGLVEGTPGNFATVCVDHKACVFVRYENNIAKCAFERAFFDGTTGWRKPVSCHLFPIRHSRSTDSIRYEHLDECQPAIEQGETQAVPLHRFLHEALERAFGPEWTRQLHDRCDTV